MAAKILKWGKSLMAYNNFSSTCLATNSKPTAKEPVYARVSCAGQLNVRELPDRFAGIICVIDSKGLVQVEDIDDGWAHVYTETGMEGYIIADCIIILPNKCNES
jgi:hypothetical protein